MSYMSSHLKIYVDASVANGNVGIGIVCPQHPSMNGGEKAYLSPDPNLAELYAIIRGMEKVRQYCYNVSSVTIVSDSSNAVSVAKNDSYSSWSTHYHILEDKFRQAKAALRPQVEFELIGGGDSHHKQADELARKAAQ